MRGCSLSRVKLCVRECIVVTAYIHQSRLTAVAAVEDGLIRQVCQGEDDVIPIIVALAAGINGDLHIIFVRSHSAGLNREQVAAEGGGKGDPVRCRPNITSFIAPNRRSKAHPIGDLGKRNEIVAVGDVGIYGLRIFSGRRYLADGNCLFLQRPLIGVIVAMHRHIIAARVHRRGTAQYFLVAVVPGIEIGQACDSFTRCRCGDSQRSRLAGVGQSRFRNGKGHRGFPCTAVSRRGNGLAGEVLDRCSTLFHHHSPIAIAVHCGGAAVQIQGISRHNRNISAGGTHCLPSANGHHSVCVDCNTALIALDGTACAAAVKHHCFTACNGKCVRRCAAPGRPDAIAAAVNLKISHVGNGNRAIPVAHRSIAPANVRYAHLHRADITDGQRVAQHDRNGCIVRSRGSSVQLL